MTEITTLKSKFSVTYKHVKSVKEVEWPSGNQEVATFSKYTSMTKIYFIKVSTFESMTFI